MSGSMLTDPDSLEMLRSLRSLHTKLAQAEALAGATGGIDGAFEDLRAQVRGQVARTLTASPQITAAFLAAMEIDPSTLTIADEMEVWAKFRTWLEPVRPAGAAK